LFSVILLAIFVSLVQFLGVVVFLALSAVFFYFASSIFSYFIHGLLQDTDNHLKPPFRVGKTSISANLISVHMWMLITAEVFGFLVLFYGVIVALF